jgi:hypothetical protein
MSAPAAAALVELVERGDGRPPLERAALLLAETAAGGRDLTAGGRNAALLALRAERLGDRLELAATCPACSAALELETSVTALLAMAPGAGEGTVEVEIAGLPCRFRLPLAQDLAAIIAEGQGEDPALRLARRCLEGPGPAPENLRAALPAIDAAMDRADPMGDIRLEVACAECDHRWLARLDPLALLWDELSDAAGRVLREVHRLARFYGWREADILALSPWRRRRYLELLVE